jgi:hypothetical protein
MLRTVLAVGSCQVVQLLALLPVSAVTPSVRYHITGDIAGHFLGRSIASLGDVDGDGVADFAVGAAPGTPAPQDSMNRVLVVSGRDGGVLRVLVTELGGFSRLGFVVVAAGDLDGDGVQDLLLPTSTRVEVRSARTGEVLVATDGFGAEPRTGLGIGDVTGDSVPDLAVSYFGAFRGSLRSFFVSVLSGALGEEIWWRGDDDSHPYLGEALAAVGDVDEDGWPDLAIGAPSQRPLPGEEFGYGKVLVVAGNDGRLLHELSIATIRDSFGISLASLSDLDGDGARELAVGSEAFRIPEQSRLQLGRVDVFSGRSGQILWTRTGRDFDRRFHGPHHEIDGSIFTGDRFGARLGNAGDVDGDGFDDLLVWVPRESAFVDGGLRFVDDSRVHLHSGRTGALLAVYETEERGTRFGSTLDRLGDVDGDGRPEFLVGAQGWNGEAAEAGRVYVMSYVPASVAFIRGDVNVDGSVNVSDAVALFRGLTQGDPLPCREASDVDRSGALDITDVVNLLRFLFLITDEVPVPDAPYPDCGRFETFRERLSCERSGCG